MDGSYDVAIRLADEGVPVAAIARATKIPLTDLWEQFHHAWHEGKLVGLPRNDWPPTLSRRCRTPEFSKLSDLSEERFLHGLMRVFTVSRLQARLLLALIQRCDISNDDLHDLYCLRSDGYHDTQIIILRLQIYRLRKKLERFGLAIETIWGFGKRMSGDHRRKAFDMLLRELEVGDLQKATK